MSTTTTLPSATGADFDTRMHVLKQIANVTGVRLPNTIIPEGESLIPYGEERKRALKDEIYALPTILQASQMIRDIRTEQNPIDASIPMQQMRMDPRRGGIYGPGLDQDKAIGYTPVAFAQATNEIKPASVKMGFGSTLAALPPAIRADAFNHFASNNPQRKNVVLRTIMAPQYQNGIPILRRSMQAVVTDRYTVVEDYSLMDTINRALPDGARVRYTQSESRSDLEILWPAMTRELKVGDIALVCLHISNSQTKQGSIRVVPKILRVLCLNFTTAWGEGADAEISGIIHVGEAQKKFAVAVARALQVVEPFVHAFGDAYQNKFPKFAPTRGEIIGQMTKAFELTDKFGESIAGVWDADGDKSAGDTLAGLVNAMTRAAQEMPIDRASDIETAAGKLIRNGWAVLQ